MTIELALVGPAGEPVDFARMIRGHGVSALPPLRPDLDQQQLDVTFPLTGRAPATVRVRRSRPGFITIEPLDRELSPDHEADVENAVRHILRLDDDLSPFYAQAARDPELAWVCAGAGRMTRCLTVFEDVVKTILTTNCAWSATIRMTAALVDQLGEPAETLADGTVLHAFPTPAAMAARDEVYYRETIRAGYRAKYLTAIATDVAGGELDLEMLGRATPEELPDDELAKRLLALPGIGPYAAAHIMLMIGRYSRPVLDSWTRPAFIARRGLEQATDAEITAHFAPYGRYAGLAHWLHLTEPWLPRPAS